MRHIIRLSTLEIENIKNVQYGKIEFARGKKGSILGIYGQNGSGKTVVVDCMVMLKCLLSGRRMPARFYHYINALAETARVQYGFEIWTDAKTMYAVYVIIPGLFEPPVRTLRAAIPENKSHIFR